MIVPVHNAEPYLEECLLSVTKQKCISLRTVQVIVYDDGSTDRSSKKAMNVLRYIKDNEEECNLGGFLIISREGPTGCGSARNRACEHATGDVFVFLDADDIMLPNRLARNVEAVRKYPDRIIGSSFQRSPSNATPRYTKYHRNLRNDELEYYAFRDAPLAMPTIACHRKVFERIGGFREGLGVPEDLHFCYDFLRKGGKFFKLSGPLVIYRWHENMLSHSLHRKTLLKVRVAAFEDIVLPRWEHFSIWGAGRDGKDCYKALSEKGRQKVREFIDIDPNKLGAKRLYGKDVVHFSTAVAPLVTCVALDRTNGEFEANLHLCGFRIGKDCIPLV